MEAKHFDEPNVIRGFLLNCIQVYSAAMCVNSLNLQWRFLHTLIHARPRVLSSLGAAGRDQQLSTAMVRMPF